MNQLAGKTVLLTREASDCADWAQQLRRLGARAVVFPCLRCEELREPAVADRLRSAVQRCSWLVLTSRRGVTQARSLVAHLEDTVRVAAVGPSTAAAARRAWGRVELVARGGTARSLANDLAEQFLAQPLADHDTVVVAAAENASHELEEALTPHGIKVERFALYRTVPAPPSAVREDLAALGIDVIFLASPSAVKGLVSRAEVPATASIVTIGPATSAAARAAGLLVAAQAHRRNLEGLVEVIP